MQLIEIQYQKIIQKGMVFLVFCLTLHQVVLAQVPPKKDYVVVSDTVFSQGKVDGLPTEQNTVITFFRSKRSPAEIYGVEEVTEFRMSDRLFFSKWIPLGAEGKVVFLERLPNESVEVTLWKLNGKQPIYYLETPEGIKPLGDDFRDVLSKAYGKQDLIPLLDITSLTEFSLNYLSKTAKNLSGPRTFTKRFTLSPWLGFSSQSVGFTIPDSNIPVEIAGNTLTVGIHGEVFLTFKRNLSLGAGLVWSQFDSQDFFSYTYNQIRYESDIFMDFSLVQVPILARYYYDFNPNRMRFYAELGHTYAIASYQALGVFQAQFERNTVTTSTKTFEMSNSFSGLTWGLGIEKYLSKHRGMFMGFRQSRLGGDYNEFVRGVTVFLGYKF